jgi:hypothetical protein
MHTYTGKTDKESPKYFFVDEKLKIRKCATRNFRKCPKLIKKHQITECSSELLLVQVANFERHVSSTVAEKHPKVGTWKPSLKLSSFGTRLEKEADRSVQNTTFTWWP